MLRRSPRQALKTKGTCVVSEPATPWMAGSLSERGDAVIMTVMTVSPCTWRILLCLQGKAPTAAEQLRVPAGNCKPLLS